MSGNARDRRRRRREAKTGWVVSGSDKSELLVTPGRFWVGKNGFSFVVAESPADSPATSEAKESSERSKP